MTLTIREHPVPAANRKTSKGTNARRYITVHETANTGNGADAAAHARLQANGNSRKASWHWTVDDHEAVRSYEHTAICWHAGTGEGNAQSIGVEICVNADGNRTKALSNAAELVAAIAREERIPLANVVQHNRWSGKNCPTGVRAGQPMGWAPFLAMVNSFANPTTPPPAPPKDDDMTPDEIRQIIREEVGRAIGWTRAVAEDPALADTDPNAKRLADRAGHLNPERKG